MSAVPEPEDLRLPPELEWLDISLSVPADKRVLGAAAAVATDIAVRSGGVGLGGALLVAVVAGGLLVLGVLLASADVVFASAFRIDVDPPSVLLHAAAIVAGAWAMGGLLRAASGASMGSLPAPPRLGWVETAVVLGPDERVVPRLRRGPARRPVRGGPKGHSDRGSHVCRVRADRFIPASCRRGDHAGDRPVAASSA